MTIVEFLGQDGVLAALGIGIVIGLMISKVIKMPPAKDNTAITAAVDMNRSAVPAYKPMSVAVPVLQQAYPANNYSMMVAAITAAVNEYRKNYN